jgi:S1-C subfamily serine protease
MTIPLRARRTTAAVAAAALALPLSVAAVAPAAASVVLVDRDWPAYPGYPAYPTPYGNAVTSSLNTTEASAAQSSGLVEITSVIDFGSGEAAGTGMVIGSDGIVVTNHHVVEGATAIKVTVVSTGRTYSARLLGTNATRDVAVLKLRGASGLTTVSTDSSGVAAGSDITAVGDAGGDGGALTAASGTITAQHRAITVTDDQTGRPKRLRDLIEIDADIIPGDSGGALLATDGDVVGMNVAASSGSSNITGYVIPIKRVLRIAAHVVAGQETAKITLGYDAFLGVSLAGSGTTLAGVLSGGGAESAGLAAGDTVTSVDGVRVGTATALKKAVSAHHPGDRVTVSWTDVSGASHTATVTLGRAPVA